MPGFDGKRGFVGHCHAPCLRVGRTPRGILLASWSCVAWRLRHKSAGRHPASGLRVGRRRPTSCLRVGRPWPAAVLTSWPGAAQRPAYELAGRRAASCLRVGRMPPGILLTSWLGESRRPACESAVRGTLAGAWPVLVSDSSDETSHGSDMRTGRLEPKWQQHAS